MPSIIKKPNPSEASQVRLMWENSFPEGGPDFVDWYFSQVYSSTQTLGLFEGDALLANLQMIPYTLKLRGRALHMDTLTGVATDPAHRKRGLAKVLMTDALADMARRGQGFTFLYPFNHEFYKRLGWETCSASLEYLLSAVELPDALPAGWEVRRMAQPEFEVFTTLYENFMAGRNCCVIRTQADWMKRIGENNASSGFQLLASHRGVPAAYALCEEQEGEISIGEMVCSSAEAVIPLLAELKQTGKPVDWIAPADDRATLLGLPWKDRAKLQPHVMFRLTDVPLAFSQTVANCGGEVAIEVTGDGMLPENNGCYLLKAQDGQVSAVKSDRNSRFSCGIGTWARILTGFIDAGDAVSAGLAAGEKDAVELLNAMYPRQNNFLFELY